MHRDRDHGRQEDEESRGAREEESPREKPGQVEEDVAAVKAEYTGKAEADDEPMRDSELKQEAEAAEEEEEELVDEQ